MLEVIRSKFASDPLIAVAAVATILATILAYWVALYPNKAGAADAKQRELKSRQMTRRQSRGVILSILLVPLMSVAFGYASYATFSAGFFSGFFATLLLYILACSLSSVLVASLLDLTSFYEGEETDGEKSGSPSDDFAAVLSFGLIQSIPIAFVFWMFLAQPLFVSMGGAENPGVGLIVILIVVVSTFVPALMMALWIAFVSLLMTSLKAREI